MKLVVHLPSMTEPEVQGAKNAIADALRSAKGRVFTVDSEDYLWKLAEAVLTARVEPDEPNRV